MSPQVSPARTGFQLPSVMLQVWLWHSWLSGKHRQQRTIQRPWAQGDLMEEITFLYQEHLGPENRKISAPCRVLEGNPPSSPSRISSNPTPLLSTPTHLCLPCFPSHLQPLESRGSLEVLDNRHHMGIRIGLDRRWNTTPRAGIKGLTLWPRRTSAAWLTLGT